MKILQITPGLIPIPNNKWGAVEKIIWNYKLQLEQLGYIVDIGSTENVEGYDIVHVHMANQALQLRNKNIFYIFTFHDHHAYLYGKNSDVYKQNKEAIDGSTITLFPAEYLLDYFDSKFKTFYFPHGVDTKLYVSNKSQIYNRPPKLLCIANNILLNSDEDRKGFRYAIEAAKKLNLNITISGPTNNNKIFFDNNKDLLKYEKLKILYDLDDEEIITLYQTHDIFINASSLEAGHPNLTILEALSCKIPVLATYLGKKEIEGLYRIQRDVDDIVDKINLINKEVYSNINIEEYNWENTVSKLEKIYISLKECKLNYNDKETKSKMIDTYKNIIKKGSIITNSIPDVNINYIDGAFCEIKYFSKDKFRVEFINNDTKELEYATVLHNNTWAKTSKQYFVNWKINIKQGDKLIYFSFLNLKNKHVFISLESKSLGDTIAWMPYIEKFKEKHECKVSVSTFWNELFEESYSDITFVSPGTTLYDINAMYRIGCFEPWGENKNQHPRDFRTIPLQQIATDILGLKYEEIKPKTDLKPFDSLNVGKYVCITQNSTAQAKYWNNESGWQETVDYLNSIGIKTVVLGIGECKLERIINKMGKLSIDELMNIINNSEFFIGISSGLAWLSWALNKPVIMISGFTKSFNEFECYRVYNPYVCNGCYNMKTVFFNKGDWNFCPAHKGTDRQFECSKQIFFEDVKIYIDDIINDNKKDYYYCPDEYGNIIKLNPKQLTKKYEWSKYTFDMPSVLPIYYEIFVEEEYNYEKCKISEGDVVVDVGANIGIFTNYAYEKGAKKVYSIEPEKKNFNCLLKNIPFKENVFKKAIGNSNTRLNLYVDKTSGGHSLLSYDVNNTRTGEIQVVESITIDTLYNSIPHDKINVLKIDVEGSELDIIYSASDKIFETTDKIIMEYHHFHFNFDEKKRNDLIQYIENKGFSSHIKFISTHLQILYFWK
jgi:autotransporter strand-loop-strand O-heptosyltransferase